MRKRVRLIILLPCVLVTCWLGMLWVHELGHVVGAVCTGGKVVGVRVPLVGFSRTEVEGYGLKVVEIWAGPVLGAVVPMVGVLGLRAVRVRSFLVEVFAGFCLVANGAYLAVGSLDKVGDTGELLREGVSIGWLWGVGTLFIAIGFCMWHGLGPRLGIGVRDRDVDAYVAVVLAVGLVVMSVVWG